MHLFNGVININGETAFIYDYINPLLLNDAVVYCWEETLQEPAQWICHVAFQVDKIYIHLAIQNTIWNAIHYRFLIWKNFAVILV